MYQANTIYHVFNQSNQEMQVFRTASDYALFVQKMRKHLLPVCDILCYCLMPTHFHIQLLPNQKGLELLEASQQQKIHAAFRTLLSSYTRAVNQARAGRGSLFRAKTKYKPAYTEFVPDDWELEEERPFTLYLPYIRKCFDYIHQNPQVVGLVTDAIEWEFSSLLDYEGRRDQKICNYELAERLMGLPLRPHPRPTSQGLQPASADENDADEKKFIHPNFLLQSPTAQRLYHEYAAELPIIDYHNHLSPIDIASNRRFEDISEVWLAGDHYKWRAMRAAGIPERMITGEVAGLDKFRAWASTVPKTLRNPLYHWTHLELERYFGISKLLSTENADQIYAATTEQLQQPSHFARGLLKQMKVEVVCTTDHPTDSLLHHKTHQEGESDLLLLPTFRPDRLLRIDLVDFLPELQRLERMVGRDITSFSALVNGLEARVDYFASVGCQLSDHGLPRLYDVEYTVAELDNILKKCRAGQQTSTKEQQQFQMALLSELGNMYADRNWTMQLHLGPLRNNNTRLLRRIGADAGCDSIGDLEQAVGLAAFLDRLDLEEQLPKTILYNLNPRDNEVFATMAGNFNDGSTRGKIQWGSAWWFLDQKDGMEKQMNALSNMGLLSGFVGMLTDSRSFLSFPRHEYFRRILCQLIGQDVEDGLLPNDLNLLGSMVADICYHNAKRYFGFHDKKVGYE